MFKMKNTVINSRINAHGQKKILSLDGGGVRGIISLEILSKMESELRAQLGKDDTFVLADYFDLIVGTSTGAIIATALALGRSVVEIQNLYFDKSHAMFDPTSIFSRIGLQPLYSQEHLVEELQSYFGKDTLLGSDQIKTLLMMLMFNVTLDQVWVVSNNPLCKTNSDEKLYGYQLDLPLWQLVRASAAAPVFFSAEKISYAGHDYTFIDGSISSFTNPAFNALIRSTSPHYNINWKTGEDQLLLVSVGTGIAPHLTNEYPEENTFKAYKNIAPAMLLSTVLEQDQLCRTFGKCVHGHSIDDEVNTMIGFDAPGTGNLFSYIRYNVDISPQGLKDLSLSHIDSNKIQKIDSVESIKELTEVGRKTANEQVSMSHFENFI